MHKKLNIKMKHKKTIWNWCRGLFILLTVLCFTPLVTPKGVYQPEFLQLPYTLWMGLLIYLIMAGLVWVGTLVHPGREEKEF